VIPGTTTITEIRERASRILDRPVPPTEQTMKTMWDLMDLIEREKGQRDG